jgi:transposase
MNIRYRVELNEAEQAELKSLVNGGRHAARKVKRAQILLAAHDGVSDEDIVRTVAASGSTVYRTKRRFVEGNLDLALSEEARPGAGRKLSGKEAALLVATACSDPPAGRKRWTLDLLAGEMIQSQPLSAPLPQTTATRSMGPRPSGHAEMIARHNRTERCRPGIAHESASRRSHRLCASESSRTGRPRAARR